MGRVCEITENTFAHCYAHRRDRRNPFASWTRGRSQAALQTSPSPSQHLAKNPPNRFDRFDYSNSTHRRPLRYPCQDLPSKRHNVAAASEPTGGGAGGGPGKGRAAGPKPLTSDPQKPSNWFDRFDSPGSALSPLLVSIPTPLRLLRLLAAIPIPPISP